MQLADALCYALLTITMTATCVQADGQTYDVEERKLQRKLSRGEATIIIDNVPVEKVFQRPKVIYRRISKKRHAPPRAPYGTQRTKYGPPRSSRKPAKKYQGTPKYGPPSHKKRVPKPPRYGPPKRQSIKPIYGPPKKGPHRSHYQTEHSGFGEPPASYAIKNLPKIRFTHEFQGSNFDGDFPLKPDISHDFPRQPNLEHDFSSPASFSGDFPNKPFGNDFIHQNFNDYRNQEFGNDFIKPSFNDYHNPKQGYAEPPVDSYGAPVKPNLHDLTHPTAQTFSDATIHLEQEYNIDTDSDPWKKFNDQKPDNSFGHSNRINLFSKPDVEIFVTPAPKEVDEELSLNSYSDIYNFRRSKEKEKRKKKKTTQNVKIINQPWKGGKLKHEPKEEIIVGGQYAEPPARYIPKFQPSAPMFTDEGDFSPPYNFPDPDEISSATMSSYVNYKNSNMAFSPQNLNDVFSIVDSN